jgi:two-component system, sensor histidine kinase PdtaS
MESFRLFLRRLHRLTLVQRYVLATAVVALAMLGQWALALTLNGHPFLMAFPPVILSAVLLGRGTGVFATLLSAFAVVVLFIEPWGLALPNEADVLAVFVFLTLSLALVPLLGAVRALVGWLDEAETHTALRLRELDHRVGNNLQLFMAMVMMQSTQSPDPQVRIALQGLAERIAVLGRLHTRLTGQDGSAVVDACSLVTDLCTNLSLALMTLRPVTLRVQAQPVPLQAEQAAVLGLLVSELVTNSFKYAFPANRPGTVEVRFWQANTETLTLVVADNGVGCPAEAAEGTGLKLVSALVQQLGGTIQRAGAAGCCVTIHLPAVGPNSFVFS